MERVAQIEKEIEELESVLDSKDSEFMETTNSFEEYSEKRRPYTSKIAKLDRERRLIMPAIMGDAVGKDDDVMSLKEFIKCCKDGWFIDYDGFGRYVKDGKESNIDIYPSDVKHNSIRNDFDTIVWYNR